VGDEDDRARIFAQMPLEQATDSASRWLVGSSSSSMSGASSRSLHSATRRFRRPRDLFHRRPVQRAAERFHGHLDLRVQVPQILGIDLVLQIRHFAAVSSRIIGGDSL